MTKQEFIASTDRAPEQDDLERVNCPSVGQAGHHQCGWCAPCDKPRFECGCLKFMPKRSAYHD